jgi:hypothetical protein
MLCAAAGAALMAGEEIGLDPESKKQSGSA